MKTLLKTFAFVNVLICTHGYAQNINVDSLLDAGSSEKNQSKKHFTEATFASTRLIDGHTVETTQGGVLDLKISHRFGRLNEGFYNMFGLDAASMRIGFDYGITNRLTIGGGRSTFEKQYDGFLKYKLLWQSEGERSMPLSVTMLTSVIYETDTSAVKAEKNIYIQPRTTDKLSFAGQLLIARKFSQGLSLQLMPTMVHKNIVDSITTPNDLFAIGAGARVRLSPRSNLNLEYYYQLPGYKLPGTYNTFSVGYEIETGGHVFELHVSNSTGMTERTVISENKGQWQAGDIHFGFNISRVFTVNKPTSTKL